MYRVAGASLHEPASPGSLPPADAGRRLTWRRYLVFGLAAIVVRAVIPDDRAAQAFAVAVQFLSFVVVWIGVSRIPAADRRPAFWFAVALSIYVAGDLFYYFYLLVRQSPRPFPSIADAFYLIDLPIFAASLLLFIRRQNPGRDVASLIDAAIVATASGLVTWVYIIEPTVVASGAPLLDRAIGMAYPLGDVLLLTVAASLLLFRGRRPLAHILLAAAIMALTLGDGLYNFLNVLPGHPLRIEPYYLLWLLWYVLAATAMLHPSLSSARGADAGSQMEVDHWRLVLLGSIVLVAPALLVIETLREEDGHLLVIAGGSVALFVLVTARMNLLMRTLRQARVDAEAANQAKSAFLATISHEIRTPLNPVIGLSTVLATSDLDSQYRSYAETIAASARSLLGLIDDILDFSKIESGSMALADEPFEIAECVESALDVVASDAQAKGLELSSRIDAGVPPVVRGDVERLRQVLVNLLSNAVKFTDRGSVSLLVRCDPAAADEEGRPPAEGTVCLRVTVRDTGIGIPADFLERIFELFVQAEASRARRYPGTGLGLAISRRLCELMGGTIWVRSESGRGSEFHFTAMVSVAADGEQVRRVQPAAVSLAGRRLLIVDGDAGSRSMFVDTAYTWGMVTASTGEVAEAVAWLERGDAFDLAVVDIGLGGAIDQLRRAGHCNELPIVAVALIGHPLPGASDGYAGWLVRPVKSSPLFDTLADILVGGWRRGLQSLGTARGPAAAVPAGELAGATPAASLRVLVAEDHPVNQQVALLLLEKLGHRADVVVDGNQVLQALEDETYDVVLMDMQMPDMDGVEASRLITQRWPAGERPRIVAVTANAMAGDREICLAAGMDDYLSKPFTMAELADVLRPCR
ncbi:MAG: response regulator [Acidimicrobiales bacterium]